MSKAIKFLEKVSFSETNEFDEIIENVSISDAITACKLQELEILEYCKQSLEGIGWDSPTLDDRITELTKQLKHIK